MSLSVFDMLDMKSPFRLLKNHMKICVQSVCLLREFFDCVFKEDWSGAEDFRDKIVQSEQQADTMKTQIRKALHQKMMLPVPREYLLSLLDAQDSLPDLSRAISGLVYGRNLVLPSEIKEDFFGFLSSSILACEKAEVLVKELGDSFESGFSRHVMGVIEALLDELSELEENNDNLQINLRNHFFKYEERVGAINAIFTYDIIDKVGTLADKSQNIGPIILLALSK